MSRLGREHSTAVSLPREEGGPEVPAAAMPSGRSFLCRSHGIQEIVSLPMAQGKGLLSIARLGLESVTF